MFNFLQNVIKLMILTIINMRVLTTTFVRLASFRRNYRNQIKVIRDTYRSGRDNYQRSSGDSRSDRDSYSRSYNDQHCRRPRTHGSSDRDARDQSRLDERRRADRHPSRDRNTRQ